MRTPSTIATLENSGADIFIGESVPFLRLPAEARIRFVRLDLANDFGEKIIDTMIEVERGDLYAATKMFPNGSSFLIRAASNVVRVLPGKRSDFIVTADGSCHVLKGQAEVITPTHLFVVEAGEIYRPGGEALGSR